VCYFRRLEKPMKLPSLRRFIVAGLFLAGVSITTIAFAAPPQGVLDDTHASVRAVMAIQGQVTGDWMKTPGILGTAVGLDANQQPALVVFVDKEHPSAADLQRTLPPQVNGVNVKIELTEKFHAYRKPTHNGGGGTTNTTNTVTVSHTAIQAEPIQLGTSGSWQHDLANGYCCGGTLGSLIQVNGVQYILSNYHVFESDIVTGGNGIVAGTGDPIVQPGLIDVNCSAASTQPVATLVKVSSLPNHNVDCSVAQVVSGAVQANGSILEIGPLSAQTIAAFLNQQVKKSGRTTGLTHSTVSGLNATISVTYDNECGGGTAFTKTYSGQIVVANSNSTFLNSGDSGSLLVEDAATNPHAVGLLFAGSSTSAIANPIAEVLSFLGTTLGGTATMVGN